MHHDLTPQVSAVTLTSAHADVVLACHQSQRRSNDCGPFSATMVINALTGYHLDPVDLAREMDKPRRRAILGLLSLVRRWPRSATFPWGMVDVLNGHGLDACWRVLALEHELRAGLRRGQLQIPIVGQWRPKPWAHYMVLLASDPERGWGFADPASDKGELAWRDAAKFASQWRNFGRVVIQVQQRVELNRRP
jgi:hypothetical protein